MTAPRKPKPRNASRRIEGIAIPPETSDDRILRRAMSIPMPRSQQGREHVYTHLYAHMSSAELHQAAQERVCHYSQPPPAPDLAGQWALLMGAWEWAAERHKP